MALKYENSLQLRRVRKTLIFPKINGQRTETNHSVHHPADVECLLVTLKQCLPCTKQLLEGSDMSSCVCIFYSNILRHNLDVNENVWKAFFFFSGTFKTNVGEYIYGFEMGNCFLNKIPHRTIKGQMDKLNSVGIKNVRSSKDTINFGLFTEWPPNPPTLAFMPLCDSHWRITWQFVLGHVSCFGQ